MPRTYKTPPESRQNMNYPVEAKDKAAYEVNKGIR